MPPGVQEAYHSTATPTHAGTPDAARGELPPGGPKLLHSEPPLPSPFHCNVPDLSATPGQPIYTSDCHPLRLDLGHVLGAGGGGGGRGAGTHPHNPGGGVVDRGELSPDGPKYRPTVPAFHPHSHLHDHPGVFGAAVEGRGELPPGGPKFSLPQSCATLPTSGRPPCNSTLYCSPELPFATTPGPVSSGVSPTILAGRLEGEDSRNIFAETSSCLPFDASERTDTPGQSSHELPAPSPGPVPNPGIFASLTTLITG